MTMVSAVENTRKKGAPRITKVTPTAITKTEHKNAIFSICFLFLFCKTLFHFAFSPSPDPTFSSSFSCRISLSVAVTFINLFRVFKSRYFSPHFMSKSKRVLLASFLSSSRKNVVFVRRLDKLADECGGGGKRGGGNAMCSIE